MSFILNIIALVKNHALLVWQGLVSLVAAIRLVSDALINGKGTTKEKLTALLARNEAWGHLFAVLRAFFPNPAFSARFVKAPDYANIGTVFVTRAEDVIEVLDREADFAVVYGTRMQKLTDKDGFANGRNFFLGMQDGPEYQHDVSIMRLVMAREDVQTIVVPLAKREAERLAAQHPGSVDLPPDLTTRVPAAIVREYFGTPGTSEDELIRRATVLFWWLFVELDGDPAVEARAREAAHNLCASVDDTIAERKRSGVKKDDLLGRALVLQASRPEFDDIAIRNNLVGIIIGAIPTLSKASVFALDALLARPEALAGAKEAARNGSDAALGAYVFEALRFNPINPVIYRRANRDVTIAASTLRARFVKKDMMVMAANLSAMFDPLKIDDPLAFRTDRPWGDYILWGYGFHACFGAHINRAVLPVMLRPLLARENLRRAEGPAGQVDGGDTPPFPQHFTVLSD
jgi:cytochrome P450